MLHELYMKNVALIDEARVRFGTGLNVLTGETGAGKTVVVGAVNLLLGGRADASLIRSGSDKAEVQGMFSIPPSVKGADNKIYELVEGEDQLIVHRIISSDGKNRCYINGRMVTVGILLEFGRHLIDLHGQHEHQSLFKAASHVNFLDRYGGDELMELRETFRETFKRLEEQKDELAELRGAERELLAKRDLLQFQVNEIDKANLVEGEDIALAREREILRSAEKLHAAITRAVNLLLDSADLASATELIARAIDELKSVSNIDSDLDGLAERLNSLLIEIEDCGTTLRDYEAKLDFPPGRLQELEDRLALISLLKKKYGLTIGDILTYRNKAADELLMYDTLDERIENLEGDLVKVEEELSGIALRQSDARKIAAEKFSNEVRRELADLNMLGADFKVSFTREWDSDGLPVNGEKVRAYYHGIDKVEFMVSANRGEPVKQLMKIASGGEISRIMLALKIILADADEVPTLIFDEIDAGIGGKTAIAVGKKMSILGRKHQVIAVTHLPQIASFADNHFTVSKTEIDDRTITEIEELLNEDRISEMARLLSGSTHSDISLKHAEELIVEAQNSKSRAGDGRVN
ncbi:MAG: DNA repair protein RecN [Actinobacteria bacterium]|nr:DNA repair protein RecN [Actinomycetota bacterium]